MTYDNEVSISGPVSVVSFRQLRLFEAVGRLGNITLTARECGLSQPAVTQSLMAFQGKIGFALIARQSKGTSLTLRGKELHSRISPILFRLRNVLGQLGVADPEIATWNLSRQQLGNLAAIREHGTLARAALFLGVTRQSVLRGIRSLEYHMGCRLLQLESGELSLTGTGNAMAWQIGLLAGELDWNVEDLQSVADRASRTIVIGVAPDPGTSAIGSAVKAHLSRDTASCIEVVEAGQSDLMARLLISGLDVMVGHVPETPHPGIIWTDMSSSNFRIVARKDHPLTSQRLISLADLAKQSWVIGAKGSQRRAASDLLFAGRSHPDYSLITSAPPLMAQLLGESDRIGLMTGHELAVRRDVLVAVPHEAPNIVARIGWAKRDGWEPSLVHLSLLAGVQQHFMALSANAD